MTTMFDDSNIRSISDIQAFLIASEVFSLDPRCSREKRAQWVHDRLLRFRYRRMSKKEKGIVRKYLHLVSRYSQPQLTRHIRAYMAGKSLCRPYNRNSFDAVYTNADAELLAKTDDLHAGEYGCLNGGSIQNICHKEYKKGDVRYRNLAQASIATIYRLRNTKRYREQCQSIGKTQKRDVSIGIRAKPEPEGKPGFIRADTVHQGDYEEHKGVYHIDTVDEVLQWQIPFAVETISMGCMKDALEEVFQTHYPFVLLGFHSDPGGEYINEKVHALMKKMLVFQTKSRPGRCTDNALVESKNGSVIRKHMGYSHIPQPCASRINVFYRDFFISYINFHRPCWFPEISVDEKGKEKRRYRAENIMTPYEKFLTLDHPEEYLRKGWSLERLEKMACAKTPNQAAADMQQAKWELKKTIERIWKEMRPPKAL